MVTRTVEIEDDLDERVQICKEEIFDNFMEYFLENPDMDDFDEYYQNQGHDFTHKCTDSNTPIYNYSIDGLWYLYSDQFKDAYEFVFGSEIHDNYKQSAIYCYISNAGFKFIHELQFEFNNCISGDDITMKEIEEALRELL